MKQDYSFQKLKIPGGWKILWNQLQDINPINIVDGNDKKWQELALSLLSLQHSKTGVIIDAGWYPEQMPEGNFRLQLLTSEWDRVGKIETRDKEVLLDTITTWMNLLKDQDVQSSLDFSTFENAKIISYDEHPLVPLLIETGCTIEINDLVQPELLASLERSPGTLLKISHESSGRTITISYQENKSQEIELSMHIKNAPKGDTRDLSRTFPIESYSLLPETYNNLILALWSYDPKKELIKIFG